MMPKSQFWVKGSLKSSSGCYESIFGSINFLICNLAFPATIAAFLAFMALKIENNEIRALLTPNKPKTTKKSKNFTFLALWPLVWPLRPLSAFYIFSEILNPKQAGIFEAKSTHFGLWQLQPHFSSKSQKQDFKWKLVSLCICRAFDLCPMLYGLAVRWQRSSLVLSWWADSAPPPQLF